MKRAKHPYLAWSMSIRACTTSVKFCRYGKEHVLVLVMSRQLSQEEISQQKRGSRARRPLQVQLTHRGETSKATSTVASMVRDVGAHAFSCLNCFRLV